MGRFAHGVLQDGLEITDTAEHLSSSINNPRAGGTLLLTAESDLDQTVAIRYQGKSEDSDTWFNLGDSVNLTSGETRVDSLTDPWANVRVRAICTVGPSTGSLTVTWAWKENV